VIDDPSAPLQEPLVEKDPDRREARIRRRAIRREAAENGSAVGASPTDPGATVKPSSGEPYELGATTRDNRHRPRAPRAERQAALATVQDQAGSPAESAALPAGNADTLALVTSLPDAKGRSGARIAARARKRQQVAASVVDGATDDPSLGALNRHLNMLMQQLMTAHRVIGRVAAEREALRQQLADLQGIPVEEIVVSSIGASLEAPTRSTSSASAQQSPSRFAKLNYFGGDDFELVRKRRLTLAAIIVAAGLVFTVVGQQFGWGMPTDLSRESLTQIAFLGPLMTLFLAGWVLFRIVRVFGRVARWVYPSENSRRRRR
jgi:hypothetical protein